MLSVIDLVGDLINGLAVSDSCVSPGVTDGGTPIPCTDAVES